MKKISLFYTRLSVYLACLFTLNTVETWAQETKGPHIEIEADPLAYIFNGYSLHAALAHSKFRYSLGIVGIKQPKFFLDNDAFSVYTTELDFKMDYLFGDVKGFYTGLQLTYGKDKIGLVEERYRENIWGITVGVRTGYRFMFGKPDNHHKGFYLTPWIALIYTPDARTIQMKTETYRQSRWFPFPTIHAGWRF